MLELLTLNPLPYHHVLLFLVIISVFIAMSLRFNNNLCVAKSVGIRVLRAMPPVLIIILHWLESSEISKFKSEMLSMNNNVVNFFFFLMSNNVVIDQNNSRKKRLLLVQERVAFAADALGSCRIDWVVGFHG